MSEKPFARVIVDVPQLPSLTYKCPTDVEIRVGDRCIVSLGRREVVGLVVALEDTTDISSDRQKSVQRVFKEVSPLDESWLRFTKFASDYYQHSWGEVALSNLPNFFRSKPGPRYAVSLERLRQLKTVSSKANNEVVLQLNDEQRLAVEMITKATSFVPFVLHGVTGSGKTEVYLRVIESVLSRNPDAQVLLLVPEINLTPQLEARIRSRFPGKRLVCMHSGLSNGDRARAWLAMHEKRAQILVGTRMATFASAPNLALIIIDEEHDLSYKAGDGVRYSARDLLIKRAQMLSIPIVLGSATPSLETWANVRSGRYQLLALHHRAIPTATMPILTVIDPSHEKLTHGLSQKVIQKISETLQRKEQVIVFLNRRGYAPVLTCPSCGWLSSCPHCSTYAVYHKSVGRLMCHHCGWSTPVYAHCPNCGNVDLVPLGTGTQKVEEIFQMLWPQARILRIDRDTTQKKNAAQEAFQAVHDGIVDILIGTQMVAKGHDFKNVSLVVVLNIDSQLASANPKSEERAFANLMQVAGRAGRSGLKAEIIVQSRFGDRAIFEALAKQDYELFADRVLFERREEGTSPYVFQALLLADASTIDKALQFLNDAASVGEALRKQLSADSIIIYDPIPMALMRVADRERAQLLIESTSRVQLNAFLKQWCHVLIGIRSSVHWVVDVDPSDI